MTIFDDTLIRLWTKLSTITDPLEILDGKFQTRSVEDLSGWFQARKEKGRSNESFLEVEIESRLMNLIIKANDGGRKLENLQNEVRRISRAFDQFYKFTKKKDGSELKNAINKLEDIIFPKKLETMTETLAMIFKNQNLNSAKAGLIRIPPFFEKEVTRIRKRPISALSNQWLSWIKAIEKRFFKEEDFWEDDDGTQVPGVCVSGVFSDLKEEEVEIPKSVQTQFLNALEPAGFPRKDKGNERYVVMHPKLIEFLDKQNMIRKEENAIYFHPEPFTIELCYLAVAAYQRSRVYDDLIYWLSFAISAIFYTGFLRLFFDENNLGYRFMFDPLILRLFFPEMTLVVSYILNETKWTYAIAQLVQEHRTSVPASFEFLLPLIHTITSPSRFSEITGLKKHGEDGDEEETSDYFERWKRGTLY